jgi:nucleoside phosphorylase
MSELSSNELEQRLEIARELLSSGRTPLDDVKYVDFELLPKFLTKAHALPIDYPEGLSPIPQPIVPKPSPDGVLPKADVVVITWTVDEHETLIDVMTPGYNRDEWYRYSRFFSEKYDGQIRNGAPAKRSKILGSYFMTKIGNKKVLCYKSELHLNQDGKRNYNGDQTSLPVRQLFKQIIEETKCSHIITAGTCGGIQEEHDLGDVLVTRAAKFRCHLEFENAPFNNKTYKSDWQIPTTYFSMAEEMMKKFAKSLEDPAVFGPPTKRHTGGNWTLDNKWSPSIIHEKGAGKNKMPEFHPILTTDYFEFGHSNNAGELWANGCGMEMGDAVLGLVCQDDIPHPPKWLIIRNLSDPQINGDLTSSPSKLNMRMYWAVWYYKTYGKSTSMMSSLTAWAVIAGL